ncbi:proliferation marker protein Ki-67 [Echinops telfairi]|uniref:Proliferation marker protein Ki-67 n=1 Tax=Echinops telfairi TaxID=9371 RepID=A0AC55D6D3_ECHTE|nr:proliferation marker protein Ki-67 [Echinops telfairi]
MGPCGRLVIIRRTGSDGAHFPLCRNSCWFGRGLDCDIRIQLPVVSQQHCRIDIQQQEALLINFSTTNPTQLNGAPVNEPVKLKHGDIITIIDRSFRFECGGRSEGSRAAAYPEEEGAQELLGHAEDAAESEKPSSAKKKGSIAPLAGGPPSSSETKPYQPRVPSRVLSDIEGWTPKVSPRKRNMSLGPPQVTSSPKGSVGNPMSEISENKEEEVSLKRRRVSFGGHLRPELFDENLPPNTPLKRGEAPGKRKSLGTPAPTVLKKAVKSPAPRKPEASPSVLVEVESASTYDVSQPHRLHTPRRRSSKGSARRKSVDKNTLKIIYPKRRSGTPKGTFSRGRSWADIVKLGTKKQDTKLVKQNSQKHRSKKPRQNAAVQKPPDHVENPFSTGHANSPCTIVIGRAHIDRVSAPARPYRMLNHLVLHKTSNLTEDFSGLTEMFKTPGKEKPQGSSMCPRSSRSSEAIFEEGNLREMPPMLDAPHKVPLATKQGAEVEDISQKSSEHKPEPGASLIALKTWPPDPAGGLARWEDLGSMEDQVSTAKSPRESLSGDLHREIQSVRKCTPKSQATPRTSPRLSRDPSTSPAAVEDPAGEKEQAAAQGSSRKSARGDTHRKTPKRTSVSGGTPRMSPRPLRSLGVSPEVVGEVSEMKGHMQTPESEGQPGHEEEVPLELQKAPGQTPRMSLRLCRSLAASPECGEDLSGVNECTPTPGSPVQPNNNAVRVAQSPPKRTPESGRTPRVTPRLLRSLGASPKVEEDLSEATDSMPFLETPGEPISDGVPLETQKTPLQTPRSEQTPRMSLRLCRSLGASPECGEDLSGMKDRIPTPESPVEPNTNAVRVAQSPPKRTPESGRTPRVTPRLLRSLGASPKVEEDLSEATEHVPSLETPGEPTTADVHLEIKKTGKHPPISGETPKRNPKSASPEAGGDLATMRTPAPTPGSPREPISDAEVHPEARQTPKLTPKSKGTPRMSLRRQRSLRASPEVGEDLSKIDLMPTPESAGESNGDVTRMVLGTPKPTPESGGTPRMTPRLVRSLGVSPEVTEDLSGVNDHLPALETPGEPLSEEEIPLEVQETPRRSGKSGRTRISPRLPRNSSASPEVMEDLSTIKGHVPTPPSPGESTRDGVHLEIQKTPRRIAKSGPTPRTSLRLLRNSSASLEAAEDLPGMKDCTPALSSPGAPSDRKMHRGSPQTPEHAPGSGGAPRVSSRLLRSLGGRPEMEHFPGMEGHLRAPESPGESVSEEVHLEIQDVGKNTPKPREMSRMSLNARKGASASPQVVEDLSRMKGDMPTSTSPRGQSADAVTMVQRTPALTRRSRGTPRTTPRQLRDPHASPEVGEDLSRMNDHTAALKPPGEPVSDKGTHLEAQQTPKPTPRSARTPRMSLRLQRSLGARSEVGEGPPHISGHLPTPRSAGQAIRIEETPQGTRETPERMPKAGGLPRMSPQVSPGAGPEAVGDPSSITDEMPTAELPEELSGDVTRRGQRTPKLSPKSGGTPRLSLRHPRSLAASPQVGDVVSETSAPAPTPVSSEHSVRDGEICQEIQKTPKRTPKSRGTPRLPRDRPADPEFEEDLPRQKGHKPTPQSPGELISDGEIHLEAQPELTPMPGNTPRMSLRLRGSLGGSPELRKSLSEMNDPVATAELAGESSGDPTRIVQRTPKLTPQSGATSTLLRSPCVSSELEGLPRRNDHMPTPEPPAQSISDGEVHMDIQKTPRDTPKSRGTPRMSPRVWEDPNANPEVGDNLASVSEHTPTSKEPADPTKHEPDSLASPTGKSLQRSSWKSEPEPRETLTLTLSHTPPETLQPEPQAVEKLGTTPRKGPERLRGFTKQPRSSTNQSAPAAEPATVKTRLRARYHPYDRVGSQRGLRSLKKTPSTHPGEESAVFPKEDDADLIATAQRSQGRPPSREVPGEDSGLQRLADTCVEAKGRPGVRGEQATSSSLCEEEPQANASEKVQPATMEDHRVPQGTRCLRRNRRGREPQESEHPPNQSENVEAEMGVKTAEPSAPAKLRQGTRCPRRNKRGGEPQESAHPPQQSENVEQSHVRGQGAPAETRGAESPRNLSTPLSSQGTWKQRLK